MVYIYLILLNILFVKVETLDFGTSSFRNLGRFCDGAPCIPRGGPEGDSQAEPRESSTCKPYNVVSISCAGIVRFR